MRASHRVITVLAGAGILAMTVAGCGTSTAAKSSGSTGTGGTASTGGTSAGGTTSPGGSTSTGGSTSPGGSASSGGSTSSGGTSGGTSTRTQVCNLANTQSDSYSSKLNDVGSHAAAQAPLLRAWAQDMATDAAKTDGALATLLTQLSQALGTGADHAASGTVQPDTSLKSSLRSLGAQFRSECHLTG
jgi:hypothetical protein